MSCGDHLSTDLTIPISVLMCKYTHIFVHVCIFVGCVVAYASLLVCVNMQYF